MLDFVLLGKWRASFKAEEMAEEFMEKGKEKLAYELLLLYNKGWNNKDLQLK